MEDIKPTIKRKRSRPAPNWNPDEVDILLNEASEHSQILSQKYTNTTTKTDKNKIWENISLKVSALGKCPRSPGACKKKWLNSRSTSTNKVRTWLKESRQTGNNYCITFISSYVLINESLYLSQVMTHLRRSLQNMISK